MADYLLDNEIASPKGFSMISTMDATGVQTYLNVEAIWRKDPGVEYKKGEWRREHLNVKYLEDLETLRKLKSLGARSIEEILSEQRSDEMRSRLERAFRIAVSRGDFGYEEQHQLMPWEGLRRMTLAMGSITPIQYGLMLPDLPSTSVHEHLLKLESEGLLNKIPGEPSRLPDRYVVSEKEAQYAIRIGEIGQDEWDRSAIKRAHQREHDEAVGDALLMIAFVANEYGTAVAEVLPESRLLAIGFPPPVPDFAVELRSHFGMSSLSCEVIGKGGAYRQSSFKKSQQRSGHLNYHPPYLGGGAYFQ